MTRNARLLLALTTALTTALSTNALAQDWTQWRGPNRDGIVASFETPAAWPQALNQHWKIEIGTGYATPILIGDRIYQFSRLGEDEVMTALGVDSGEVIWQTRYPAPFNVVRAAAGHGPGPKSTPTFVDGHLCSSFHRIRHRSLLQINRPSKPGLRPSRMSCGLEWR